MDVTYSILVMFEESALSDIVTVEANIDDVEELDIYDHAEICARLLNEFCNMKQQVGKLLKFECEGMDLTEQMNEILIKHEQTF